jgi:hypothetical protein
MQFFCGSQKIFKQIMKVLNLKKNLFLLLGLTALLVGVLYFFIIEKNSQNNLAGQYQTKLQKNITRELLISDYELNQLVKQVNLKKFGSFEQLKITTKYPYFIFRNKQIAYWSDYRVVPKYEKLAKNADIFFDSYFQNKGIFQKKSTIINKDTIEIFSLISLYRFYQNQNDYLQSSYNSDIFHPAPVRISDNNFDNSKTITDFSKKALFYYQGPGNDKIINSNIPKITLWIFVVSLVFLLFHFILQVRVLLYRHKFSYAIILLFIVLVLLRIILLTTGLPWVFLNQEVFNPSFYNGSFLTPTLGDTVLNGLFILIFLAVLALYYYRTRLFLEVNKAQSFIKSVVSVLMVLAVMALANLCGSQIEDIYENSLYYQFCILFFRFRDFFHRLTYCYQLIFEAPE